MKWFRNILAKHGSLCEIGKSSSDVIILTNGDNASLRYLLLPHLHSMKVHAVCVDPETIAPESLSASPCKTLVISRYLPVRWLGELQSFRKKGGRLIYFMDDDLMDANALSGLPVAYASKIRRAATSQMEVITGLCAEFWVGSEYLAEKYSRWSPVVLEARPALAEVEPAQTTTVCYHGTASHQWELDWLAPIMRQVLKQSETISFEVFGDHQVNRRYRELPRVAVLHPMSWHNYLAYTGSVTKDIALAPLMPQPFNSGRGPTKFFDFVRMGAVGVYTDVFPYRGFVRDGVDGILLENDPVLWSETILQLSNDSERRARIVAAAKERAIEMAWDRKPDTFYQLKQEKH